MNAQPPPDGNQPAADELSLDFNALWDYNQPAETEQKFRALLGAHAEADREWRAELLTQLARSEGLQRKFAQAHRTLDDAFLLMPNHTGRATVRYLLERGRVYNSACDRTQACPLFRQALELARTCGEDSYAVDAAHMLGIADEPERRLAWHAEALALAEASANPRARGWRGTLYNNIGWTLHDAGRFDEALQAFQQALACRIEQGKREDILIARWCIARTLRSLGRIDEALAMQRALQREREADGTPGGYVFEELGECLLALGHPVEARSFFRQAYATLSQDIWLSANEAERLKRLQTLGNE